MKVLKKKPGESWELIDIDSTWEAPEKEIGERFITTRYAIDVTDEVVKLLAPELLADYATGKSKFDKEKFLETKFGRKMKKIIRNWDRTLDMVDMNLLPTEKYEDLLGYYSDLWDVFQLALEQFCGIDCNFARTRDYAGVMMNDGEWLYRVIR